MTSIDDLVEELDQALGAWDKEVIDYQDSGLKLREEVFKALIRERLRRAQVRIPEIIRWELRARIGYRSEEE